jgi:hypothetical protein
MRNPFGKRQYYYIVTRINGRLVIWMKSDWKSEADANAAGFRAVKGQLFTVVAKPFNNVARVTQEMKSQHLEESCDLESSIQRAKHQLKDKSEIEKDDAI